VFIPADEEMLNGRIRGAADSRHRQEQPVEDVLEFGANAQVVPAFSPHPEVPSEAHRFRGLALPAVVVVERSGNAEGPAGASAQALGLKIWLVCGWKQPQFGSTASGFMSGT
jgi:hypothetical protein